MTEGRTQGAPGAAPESWGRGGQELTQTTVTGWGAGVICSARSTFFCSPNKLFHILL